MQETFSKRELVLEQRKAFMNGVDAVFEHFGWERVGPYETWQGSANIAAKRYPLPKTTRPRVVADPTSLSGIREWRAVGGVLETRRRDNTTGKMSDWKRSGTYDRERLIDVEPTPARIAMWNDLLANPTEEVEDA